MHVRSLAPREGASLGSRSLPEAEAFRDSALTEQDSQWGGWTPYTLAQVISTVTGSAGTGAAAGRGGLVEEVGLELIPGCGLRGQEMQVKGSGVQMDGGF